MIRRAVISSGLVVLCAAPAIRQAAGIAGPCRQSAGFRQSTRGRAAVHPRVSAARDRRRLPDLVHRPGPARRHVLRDQRAPCSSSTAPPGAGFPIGDNGRHGPRRWRIDDNGRIWVGSRRHVRLPRAGRQRRPEVRARCSTSCRRARPAFADVWRMFVHARRRRLPDRARHLRLGAREDVGHPDAVAVRPRRRRWTAASTSTRPKRG